MRFGARDRIWTAGSAPSIRLYARSCSSLFQPDKEKIWSPGTEDGRRVSVTPALSAMGSSASTALSGQPASERRMAAASCESTPWSMQNRTPAPRRALLQRAERVAARVAIAESNESNESNAVTL